MLRLCRFYVDTAGEQLKQSGQAQAVFDRALQSPPDSAVYQIVTNSITVREAKLDEEIGEIQKHYRQVREEAGEEPTAEAEKLLVADIKQVWGKYQEKDRLKTSVEGISAEDIGRAQEMLEQDALQQMKKPQLIFESNVNAKSGSGQIVSVSAQIPKMVSVGQNVQAGVENGINDQQLTDYTRSDIKGYIPKTPDGNIIPLRKQRVNGQDIPLPDPDAVGPHTVLGGKTGTKTGETYRQSATFPVGTWPLANGSNVPWSEVHWSSHGRSDHQNPHQHVFVYQPERGGWIRKSQEPFYRGS